MKGSVGKGMFSNVLLCEDTGAKGTAVGQSVAVKVIRNNDVMRKAADTELDILRLLTDKDPEDKKHCIRLINNFDHHDHICMVSGATWGAGERRRRRRRRGGGGGGGGGVCVCVCVCGVCVDMLETKHLD